MVQMTIGIDGMACSMCEAHVSEAIRKAGNVKKVTASHTKGQAVVIADEPISEEALRAALDPTGYRVTDYACKPYEKKKGLFGGLFG